MSERPGRAFVSHADRLGSSSSVEKSGRFVVVKSSETSDGNENGQWREKGVNWMISKRCSSLDFVATRHSPVENERIPLQSQSGQGSSVSLKVDENIFEVCKSVVKDSRSDRSLLEGT